MSVLRPALQPGARDPATVANLTDCIDKIVDALETGVSTDALMAEHNRLAARDDIGADRYVSLHASMSSKEAAEEALTPEPRVVPDISRAELEEIARVIVQPDDFSHQSYYVKLFELNTPHGNSDLFFWPDPEWIKSIGTDTPTPSQYVEKALHG